MNIPIIPGFRFSTVAAGIRKDGRADLALAVADAPAVTAGVFTRNLVRAAPVILASERVRAGGVRGVLVNSGCANACTGDAGLEAALTSTRAVAEALALPEASLLPASTGVIGELLPAARITAKAAELARGLGPERAGDFARAILTTDRWEKVSSCRFGAAGGEVSLLGLAKGAGMIHPDLGLDGPPQATMLAFLFTDARVERATLERALMTAVDSTFNACTVDGDTSTNDTVLAFASGASGRAVSEAELAAALGRVCAELARSMVADGEGAEHVAEIRVTGLASTADARQVARTIATSLLVKTAIFGRDANWGRLLAAAGRAGVRFEPSAARIAIGGVELVSGGLATGGDADARATVELAKQEVVIELSLGDGPGAFTYLASDLGHGYVDVNASYRS